AAPVAAERGAELAAPAAQARHAALPAWPAHGRLPADESAGRPAADGWAQWGAASLSRQAFLLSGQGRFRRPAALWAPWAPVLPLRPMRRPEFRGLPRRDPRALRWRSRPRWDRSEERRVDLGGR